MDNKFSTHHFNKLSWIGSLGSFAKLHLELWNSTKINCSYDLFIRHFSIDGSLALGKIHYNGTATELMCLIEDLIEIGLIVRCSKMHMVVWHNFCDRNGNDFNADSLKTFMNRGRSIRTNNFVELILNKIQSKKTG